MLESTHVNLDVEMCSCQLRKGNQEFFLPHPFQHQSGQLQKVLAVGKDKGSFRRTSPKCQDALALDKVSSRETCRLWSFAKQGGSAMA